MRGSAPYDELDEGTLCNSVLCRERAASTASTATSSELENALTVDYRLGMGCAVSGPLPPHPPPPPAAASAHAKSARRACLRGTGAHDHCTRPHPPPAARSKTGAVGGEGDASGGSLTAGCWTKWYILIVTSYASGLQGLLWMTYSIIPAVSKTFLQIGDGSSGDSVLLWLLNAGPIAYILTVTCASATLDAANGLRSAVLWGSGMCLVAAVMRCIPLLFTQTWSPFKVDDAVQGEGGWPQYLLVPVFIAQIINAAAAPFTQASPSLLSQVRWGEAKRTTVLTFRAIPSHYYLTRSPYYTNLSF